MLVIVGSNRSIHCLTIEDGNRSRTQDYANPTINCDATFARELREPEYITVILVIRQ